jgi:high affinity Mn2+ porin
MIRRRCRFAFFAALWCCQALPAMAAQDGLAPSEEAYSVSAQATFVTQQHDAFAAPYSGANSLFPGFERKNSLSTTLFLGARLWRGAEIYADPEVIKGRGLSNVLGIAGFPNGDVARVGDGNWKFYHARIFLRQTFGLGGEAESIAADQHQLAGVQDDRRVVISVGNFSAADFFDDNAYSHDPRTQFLNWSLMANGAWDYPADARGYTNGVVSEWIEPGFALRAGLMMMPVNANQLPLDHRLSVAHGAAAEWERAYAIGARPGKLRLLAYLNRANMGSYRVALANTGPAPDVTATRATRTKYGFGVNIEQQIDEALGMFARLGWNDGATETWCFTEIDRSASVGALLRGVSWGRAEDTVGIATVVNGLSSAHRDYLAAGGYGFMLGDGRLNYRREAVVETFYSLKLFEKLALSLDYQRAIHPAYNADRGPVNIWTGRIHVEF